MRSPALNSTVSALFLFVLASSAGANTCKCPAPPGGSHSCSAAEAAVCRVQDGECVGSCHSASGLSVQVVAAGVLSDVLGKDLKVADLERVPGYRNAFLGLVESTRGGDTMLLGQPGGTSSVVLPASYGRKFSEYAQRLKLESGLGGQDFFDRRRDDLDSRLEGMAAAEEEVEEEMAQEIEEGEEPPPRP